MSTAAATPFATHSTRMWVDATRQITVDWRVIEYWILNVPKEWSVFGLCRLWQVTQVSRGQQLCVQPLSDTYEIVARGETIEAAAQALMSAAWTQCTEGKPPTGTEH